MTYLIAEHSNGDITVRGTINDNLIITTPCKTTSDAIIEWWRVALEFGEGDLDAGEDFKLPHEGL